jgi:hypothetical protein
VDVDVDVDVDDSGGRATTEPRPPSGRGFTRRGSRGLRPAEALLLATACCFPPGCTAGPSPRDADDGGPEAEVPPEAVDDMAGADDDGPADETPRAEEGGEDSTDEAGDEGGDAVVPTPPGGSRVAYLPVDGLGDAAVRIDVPDAPRYDDGAPVVVEVKPFFTPERGWYASIDAGAVGMLQVLYLWPGDADEETGEASAGTYDHGGEPSLRALAEVVRFASGEAPDRDGHTLPELVGMAVLADQVGLYAFSHPGIAATNLLALHGARLPHVRWMVNRESPTVAALSCLEAGYFDEADRPVPNPLYRYPDGWSSTAIAIDYSGVHWNPASGRPYFDLDASGSPTAGDHELGHKVPEMFGEIVYSAALTRALADGGLDPWPAGLATAEEAEALWPGRESAGNWDEAVANLPGLKVLLLFARRDHVQPARDKPHVHQAYDGFRAAGVSWIRLNPDLAYDEWAAPAGGAAGFPEVPANEALSIDAWANAEDFSYPGTPSTARWMPWAAVAEMADRTHEDRWSAGDDDLEDVLVDAPRPSLPGP